MMTPCKRVAGLKMRGNKAGWECYQISRRKNNSSFRSASFIRAHPAIGVWSTRRALDRAAPSLERRVLDWILIFVFTDPG